MYGVYNDPSIGHEHTRLAFSLFVVSLHLRKNALSRRFSTVPSNDRSPSRRTRNGKFFIPAHPLICVCAYDTAVFTRAKGSGGGGDVGGGESRKSIPTSVRVCVRVCVYVRARVCLRAYLFVYVCKIVKTV